MARPLTLLRFHLPGVRQGAIDVAVNYGGAVNIIGCAFAGPELVEPIQQMPVSKNLRMGALASVKPWSRPVNKQSNCHAPTPHHHAFPSFEQLAARLPAQLRSGGASGGAVEEAGGAARRGAPPVAVMQRTCRTEQESHWAPTAHQFYAIGKTFGYNVLGPGATAAVAAQEGQQGGGGAIRVLLAACGDIRNLIATGNGAMAAAATDMQDSGVQGSSSSCGGGSSSSVSGNGSNGGGSSINPGWTLS